MKSSRSLFHSLCIFYFLCVVFFHLMFTHSSICSYFEKLQCGVIIKFFSCLVCQRWGQRRKWMVFFYSFLQNTKYWAMHNDRNQDLSSIKSKCNQWRSFHFSWLQTIIQNFLITCSICASFFVVVLSFSLNASLSATNRCNNNKTYRRRVQTSKYTNTYNEWAKRHSYAGRWRNEMSFRLNEKETKTKTVRKFRLNNVRCSRWHRQRRTESKLYSGIGLCFVLLPLLLLLMMSFESFDSHTLVVRFLCKLRTRDAHIIVSWFEQACLFICYALTGA